jgi:ribosomal protein S12 methylthiotransferase accessory factor
VIELSDIQTDTSAIYYRGQSFRAEKLFWHGTQRTRAPQETLDIIRPYFKTAGLTRLANITGLDRIGIPTVLAVRPNGPTITTSTGKGFTIEAAMASAAMEAIEIFHAENARLPSFQRSYEQLSDSYKIIPIENLPLTKNSMFHPSWPYHWVLGWDIINQTEVAVPLIISDLVIPIKESRIWNLSSFQMNSNGLASGNTFLEALAAGLYEVIERDGITLHSIAGKLHQHVPPVVRLDTIEHPLVLELLERCKAADVAAMLFDCTVDTDVPIYQAYIYERSERHHLGIFKGCGAHLDSGIAMIRALTEAIQSRLVYIAGSRDDVFRHTASRVKRGDSATAIQWLEAIDAKVDYRMRQSQAASSFQEDIHITIGKLKRVGIDQVIVFDITLSNWPISAVRIFVPGLEGYKSANYAEGRRAKDFCERIQE